MSLVTMAFSLASSAIIMGLPVKVIPEIVIVDFSKYSCCSWGREYLFRE